MQQTYLAQFLPSQGNCKKAKEPVDMSQYCTHLTPFPVTGVPACMVVMTLPSKRAAQPGSPTKLLFILVDRSAPQL